tara:strand:+ start:92 stop:334 length:243 start_codon:yes stop_codon:yes gene_type:complete
MFFMLAEVVVQRCLEIGLEVVRAAVEQERQVQAMKAEPQERQILVQEEAEVLVVALQVQVLAVLVFLYCVDQPPQQITQI